MQIAQGLRNLGALLAHAQNEVGLSDEAGAASLRDHVKRALVAESRSDALEDARDGFEVVRKHLGSSVEYLAQKFRVSAEIRNQNLHARPGGLTVNFANGFGVQPRSLVVEVIAGHPGNSGVAELHGGNGFADTARLVGIEGIGLAGVNLAEVASTRALRTADEERCLPIFPALVDVGTTGLLAHGVQAL